MCSGINSYCFPDYVLWQHAGRQRPTSLSLVNPTIARAIHSGSASFLVELIKAHGTEGLLCASGAGRGLKAISLRFRTLEENKRKVV